MDRVRRSLKSGAFGVEKCRSVGLFHLVRPNGLEPSTPTMSRWCSNQLSYGRTSDKTHYRLLHRILVRPNGLEPSTPTMSRWCSNQLSYGRIFFCLPVRQRGRILTTYPMAGKGK